MSTSIFTRTYLYRKRENKNNLENYLIEIFAYCLEIDIFFRQSFLTLIEIEDDIEYIATQFSANNNRPDIQLTCINSIIFIECKIEAGESPDQIAKYKLEVQNSQKQHKKVVYITKYLETKDCIVLNWSNINALITDKCHPITIELKQFLNDNNITMTNNFDPLDLVVLKHIDSSIFKMAEPLNAAKIIFDKSVFELQSNSPEIGLRNQKWYGHYKVINSIIHEVNIGFMWHFKNDDNIYAGLTFVLYKYGNETKCTELIESLKDDWFLDDLGNEIWFSKRINLIDILAHTNQNKELVNIFAHFIESFKQVITRFPNYFQPHSINI